LSKSGIEQENLVISPDEQRRVILVVDDNAGVRQLVSITLESAGYTVASASDGVTGLAFFTNNRTAIALLLTDVVMPGMNGIELVNHVRAVDGALPVLFMSGSHFPTDRGDPCLPKPFNCSELLASVQKVLGDNPCAR
jgi:two-component system OmpR family response regulator